MKKATDEDSSAGIARRKKRTERSHRLRKKKRAKTARKAKKMQKQGKQNHGHGKQGKEEKDDVPKQSEIVSQGFRDVIVLDDSEHGDSPEEDDMDISDSEDEIEIEERVKPVKISAHLAGVAQSSSSSSPIEQSICKEGIPPDALVEEKSPSIPPPLIVKSALSTIPVISIEETNTKSASDILMKKRERMKRALKKAELEKAKTQLALAQLLKEEALKNAKEQLALAQQRKGEALEKAKAQLALAQQRMEEALKANALQKKDTNVEDKVPVRVGRQNGMSSVGSGTNKRHHSRLQKDGLDDISAFTMKTLLLTNIGSYGSDEKIHHRTAENHSDDTSPEGHRKRKSRCRNANSSDMGGADDDERKGKAQIVPPVSDAARLRLNLALAKRRLRLEELKNAKSKRVKVTSEAAPVREEENSVGPVNEAIEMNIAVGDGILVNEGNATKRETFQDLLKRQEELRENINASREAQKVLKGDQEVSNLLEMIEKQRALLEYHGQNVRSCTTSLIDCKTSLVQENQGQAQSERRLKDLVQRKAATENMVRSVTKKIMRLRRRREKGNGGAYEGS